MTRTKGDTLLTVAKVGITVVHIGVAIGIAGLVIAAFGIFGGYGDFAGELTRAGQAAGLAAIRGAIAGMLLLAFATLLCVSGFVRQLARMIDTVGQGDPFIPENADRLTRMAWLAVAIQFVALVMAPLAGWLALRLDEGVFELRSDFSFTGLGLAVVLFILARVFRKGAAMRDDLEGTV
jgi:hypothetical protein